MKYVSYFTSTLLLIALLPGCCSYYIDWATETFANADKACYSVKEVQCQVVRTVRIRDDFGLLTKEIARVLWVNDDAVILYEQLKGSCSGEHATLVEKKIQEGLKKNNETATFFVSLYSTKEDWSFSLCKDGRAYKASEVRQADLDHTYQVIFGEEAFRYKQHIYKVSFDVTLTPPFDFVFCNSFYQEAATYNANCCCKNRNQVLTMTDL